MGKQAQGENSGPFEFRYTCPGYRAEKVKQPFQPAGRSTEENVL